MSMLIVVLTIGLTGCFGNFAATRKVYEFNESFGDKWMNQVLFWVMNIVPVYKVATFADVVLFNTVEFWTGINPIAMNPSEEIIRYAHQEGKTLKISIRHNQIIVEDMENPAEELKISYKALDKSWYYHSDNGMIRIAALSEDKADFFRPNGKTLTMKAPV